jgi:hypothetical protein
MPIKENFVANLASMLNSLHSLVKLMDISPTRGDGISKRHIFKNLDEGSRSFLIASVQEDIALDIILFISNDDLVKIFPSLPFRLRAPVFTSVRDNQRERILDSLESKRKDWLRKSVIGYQKWQEVNWEMGISSERVMIGEFPAHYPKEMRKCIVCTHSFSEPQNIISADCGKHAFHEHCEKDEGICPKCEEERTT